MSSTSGNPGPVTGQPFAKRLPLESSDYFEILGTAESNSFRSGLVTLMPGKDVGWHSTEEYEELLIVLEGNGKLLFKGFENIDISSGEIAYNPARTQHNVVNTGHQPMRYIYVVAPTR